MKYSYEDYYPMHMPGHKRNTDMMKMINPYSIDITEIEGFDNLHQPEGIIKQLSERMEALYKTNRSFPLVNGSTSGILAGICAATNYNDQVIVARNCHKSVYHAIALKGLIPIYYYPHQVEEYGINGGILPSEIEELLIKNKNISLVVITSPTYEGVVSDIKELSKVVHKHGARLLVDEAHGAHFGFHEGFPKSSIQQGADIVIQSLHKTLPSLTQTAVLHSNADDLNKKIQRYLTIYQSSSPSYILMSGIDQCITLLEEKSRELFHAYHQELMEFYQSMEQLKNLKLLTSKSIGTQGIFDLDPSKITISVRNSNMSGHTLQKILYEEYHIVMEMETPEYILGMTSIGDRKEGFERLSRALIEIDKRINVQRVGERKKINTQFRPQSAVLLSEAIDKSTEQIPLSESNGRISGAYICMYPPGSPILVPGERIEEKILNYIDEILKSDTGLTGLCEGNQIDVLVE